MATSAALSLKDPIIPLVCSFQPEYLRTTKVEWEWETGAGANVQQKRSKMYLPCCDDPSNKELVLYVVDQFLDAAHNDRLHLSTGPSRYTKFRQVLGGALLLAWQEISDARNNPSVDSFYEDLSELLLRFMAPSSFEDQRAYMLTAEKPFNMDCEALGARLRVISRLGRFLPGAPGLVNDPEELYLDEAAFKRAYFSMMRGDWKVKFVSLAHNLDDDTFTYQRLVRFMAIQEGLSKQGLKRSRQGHGGYHGGRGGGHGHGRGGYGRGSYGFGGSGSYARGYSSNYGGGRGRGNSGNYQYRGLGYGGRHYQNSYSPGGTPGYAQGFRTPTQGTSTPTYGGRGRGSYGSYGRGSSGRGSSYGRGNTSYGRGAQRQPFSPGGRQVVYPGVAPTGPRPPSIPNFMTDNYHQEEQPPVDNYYQEQPVEDQYYDGKPVEQQYSNDQYYQEGPPEEHYMADDNNNNGGGDSYPEEHYFQDFGF